MEHTLLFKQSASVQNSIPPAHPVRTVLLYTSRHIWDMHGTLVQHRYICFRIMCVKFAYAFIYEFNISLPDPVCVATVKWLEKSFDAIYGPLRR